MTEPRTYGRLGWSTNTFRPAYSKTSSPSRFSSNARLYWKPEQPPPLTPTRRPAADGPNPIREAISEAIAEHRVILFMKGTPEAPACGFSARTVAILQALDTPFAAVDILPDPRIRQELSAISEWPTIPQLFVRGELIGGCDIVTEMFETGELAQTLGVEQPVEAAEPADEPEATGPQAPPLGIENRLS